MKAQRRVVFWIGLFLLSVPAFHTLLADATDDRVRKIAHQLRCPTCQGLSVKESEAGFSLNMKSKIRLLLQEGKSEEEILQFFKERYGEWILRNPEKSGFNLILWFLPGVVIVLAALLLFFHLKKGRPPEKKAAAEPLSDREKAQFESDFEKLLKE